jgi:predicted lipid-binding transport protein (Tim44 family)
MLKILLNNIDLVLLALLVLFLLFNLSKLLGKRGGATVKEEEKIKTSGSSFFSKNDKFTKSILDVKAKEKNDAVKSPIISNLSNSVSQNLSNEIINNYPEGSLMYELTNLSIKDTSFEVKSFLEFAKNSFSKIVVSFGLGEVTQVESLLTNKMYSGFLNYIQSNTNFTKTKIIIKTFVLTDIIAISWMENVANLKVKFISKQNRLDINASTENLPSIHDQILEETWTFSKDFSVKESSWLLSKTE